jgi:hypothetical protein
MQTDANGMPASNPQPQGQRVSAFGQNVFMEASDTQGSQLSERF